MTANELADELDLVRIELTIQASAMLRQQQAEIQALKNELKRYADAIGEERGNKALRNHEIAEILTKVLDDCGLLKKACNKCNDTGWVCEWHPDKEAHKCCGGAGMPCECTKEDK